MVKKRLVVVLGDQLTPGLSSLQAADPETDVVIMGEVFDEARYVNHHRKKLVFIFSAMRHFAEELRGVGWTVDYAALDGASPKDTFDQLVADAVKAHRPREIIVTEAGEHRVRKMIATWSEAFGVPVRVLNDDRFLADHGAFKSWAAGKKSLRMEYFYREMRRKTGLLMEAGSPVGGKWNYDAENRSAAPSDLAPPQPAKFDPDDITKAVIEMVARLFPSGFGDIDPFWFAVTRRDAEQARDHFMQTALPLFGDYQDAMLLNEKFLYHSILSAYLNIGLLDPLDLCQRAEAAYNAGEVPINAAEGYIRQIIGWREFVRGVYFLKGPDYIDGNYLEADLPLPDFYWTGETDMACVKAAVSQTIEEAYAHHIQRLMVTGTFALIVGVNPHEVHEWYLAVYADAYEWVEAPNVIGMSQFADGGVVASKPYAASGAYINRMSNYCKTCAYKVAKKSTVDACPFNALYWDFMLRNENKLRRNPRISRAYSSWDRMKEEARQDYLERAASIRRTLRNGERL